jgi:hypothetical protein
LIIIAGLAISIFSSLGLILASFGTGLYVGNWIAKAVPFYPAQLALLTPLAIAAMVFPCPHLIVFACGFAIAIHTAEQKGTETVSTTNFTS